MIDALSAAFRKRGLNATLKTSTAVPSTHPHAVIVLMLALAIASACTRSDSPDSALKISPEPLAHHQITLAALPAPFATKSVSNPPRMIPGAPGPRLDSP